MNVSKNVTGHLSDGEKYIERVTVGGQQRQGGDEEESPSESRNGEEERGRL